MELRSTTIIILRLRSRQPQVFSMLNDPWQAWLSAFLEACHRCPPSNAECTVNTVCVDVQPFFRHEVVCKGHTFLLAPRLVIGVIYNARGKYRLTQYNNVIMYCSTNLKQNASYSCFNHKWGVKYNVLSSRTMTLLLYFDC